MKNVTIFMACTDLGETFNGTDLGPTEIYKKINKVNINDVRKVDKKNVEKELNPNNLAKNIKYVNEFNDKLYNEILNSNTNNFPIVIGGDHSVAMPSALANNFIHKKIGIIWVDAHLDYNTFSTTITGNIHGLPLAGINGLCKDITKYATDYIDPKNTVVVGYHSNETNKDEEINNVLKAGGTIFTIDDLRNEGISSIMQKAFAIALNGTSGVHISYDIDIVDKMYAPGVSVCEENGITKNEALEITDYIVNHNEKLISFDLVEYNPLTDENNKTLDLCVEIIDKITNSLV